ncbi:MAG: DUF2267 domain-containing protein [Gammaproteobacteria bacterium]
MSLDVMSLEPYRRQRLVILKPSTSVLDAARAIEQNRIGAIIVQDEGRIVGIVTDRDLAVRALGRALDPNTTTLAEVMSAPPITLSPTNIRADAVRLMKQYNVRRIPLVENERVVGIVTLDDLLLDEAAPLDELAGIVETQLGEGGPAESPRSPAQQRRQARATAAFRRFLNAVRDSTGIQDIDQAHTALLIVLRHLLRRLTPEEASDLAAQLPSLLQEELRTVPPGPDKSITRETIEEELAQQLHMDRSRAATLFENVGAAIASSVSPGQMEDVCSQLPANMRRAFEPAGMRPH